jgi:hypothetical protein
MSLPLMRARALRKNKSAISNVIVAMLSLILVTIVVSNVILWSYQMNQFDLQTEHEAVKITEVANATDGTQFDFENTGSVTAHIVALWIDNSTQHQRYQMNLFINSGDTISYHASNINLPEEPYTVKIVTERGNLFVLP